MTKFITATQTVIYDELYPSGTVFRRTYSAGKTWEAEDHYATQLINDGQAALSSDNIEDLPDQVRYLVYDATLVNEGVDAASAMTDNGDGTFTFVSSTGANTTFTAGAAGATPVIPPSSDDSVGSSGSSSSYARADHKHPAQKPSADAGNDLRTGSDGLAFFEETVTSIGWDKNTSTLTYTNEAGASLEFQITGQASSIADNGDGTYTHSDGAGNNFVFKGGVKQLYLSNTAVAPATAGEPTDAEILAAAGAERGVFVKYTGTDTPTDPVTKTFHIDAAGNVMAVGSASATITAATDAEIIAGTADKQVDAAGFRKHVDGNKVQVGSGAPVDGTTNAWFQYQLYLDADSNRLYKAATPATNPNATAAGSVWAPLTGGGEALAAAGPPVDDATTAWSVGQLYVDTSTGELYRATTASTAPATAATGSVWAAVFATDAEMIAGTDHKIVDAVAARRHIDANKVLAGVGQPVSDVTTAWFAGQLYTDTATGNVYYATTASTAPEAAPTGSVWDPAAKAATDAQIMAGTAGNNFVDAENFRQHVDGNRVQSGAGAPVDGTTTAWFVGQLYMDTTNRKLYRATTASTVPATAATGSVWVLLSDAWTVATGAGAPVDGTTTAWAAGQLYVDTTDSALYRATAASTAPETAATGSTWVLLDPFVFVENVAAFFANTATYPANTYVKSKQEGHVWKAVAAAGTYTVANAGGQNFDVQPAHGDVVYAEAFGLIGDGAAVDQLPTAQKAVDFCINNLMRKLILPAGEFLFDGTLHIKGPTGGFRSLEVEGQHGAFLSSGGTRIDHAAGQLLNPLIAISAVRDVAIRNLHLRGNNVAPSTLSGNGAWRNPDLSAGYITAGASTAQHAPYCAVVIDGLTGADPGGAFTFDTYGYATSSKILIEDSYILNFVGAIAVMSTTGSENYDFRRIEMIECAYGLITTESQQRDINGEDLNFNGLYCAVDNTTFGTGNGTPPKLTRGIWAKCFKLFQLNGTIDVLSVEKGYCESVAMLGNLGAGSNTVDYPAVFESCTFSFIGVADAITDTNKDAINPIYMPMTVIGGTYSFLRTLGFFAGASIDMIGVNLSPQGTLTAAESDVVVVGSQIGGLYPLTMRGVKLRKNAGGDYLLDTHATVMSMPTRARVANNVATIFDQSTGRTYHLEHSPAMNGRDVTVGADQQFWADQAATTAGNDFVTMTYTVDDNNRPVRVGDLIAWRCIIRPFNSGAVTGTGFVPALEVVDLTGGVMTCRILGDIDQTYTGGGVNVWNRRFINSTESTGDTNAGSTSITNVTNIGNWEVGDWLSVANENTRSYLRVDGITGTTITLSATPARTLTGAVLYNTRLVDIVEAATRLRIGTGSPEGALSAPVGTLFLNTAGSTGTTLYVKESGSDATGWTAK